jgi:hypothetical protein
MYHKTSNSNVELVGVYKHPLFFYFKPSTLNNLLLTNINTNQPTITS